MISVSSNYKTNATKPVRNINAKISIGTVDFGIDDIVSFELSRSPSDGGLSVGGTAAARLTATIRATMLPTMDDYKVTVFIGFTALTQIGTFYITDLTQEKGYVTIEAYDRFYYLDKPCSFNGSADGKVESLSFPATHQEMLEYISKINGFSLSVTCESFAKVTAKPIYNSEATNPTNKYYTYREIIGFIAACNGCNAQFDANDKLIFTRPSNSVEIIEEGACESLSVAQDSGFTVKGIRFTIGTDTAFYIDANGTTYDETLPGVLEAVNPLATVEIMEYVWNKLGGYHYYAADISRRGRGWLLPDDVISIKSNGATKKATITAISYSLSKDSGFLEQITSTAESTDQSSNRYSAAGDHTSNVGAGKYNSTTIINDPVIISEKTKEYLKYDYSIIGYSTGDQVTYAHSVNDRIVVNGYISDRTWGTDTKPNVFEGYSKLYFPNGAGKYKDLSLSFRLMRVEGTFKYIYGITYSYVLKETGEKTVVNRIDDIVTNGTVPAFCPTWSRIFPPSTNHPSGYIDCSFGVIFYSYTNDLIRSYSFGNQEMYNAFMPEFASLAEYNAAVQVTNVPLEKNDVFQTVSKVVEAGGTADFPELGENDVLYIDSTDNSAYKWSSKISAYYCVGRDYFSIKQIQSAAEPNSSDAEILEAQLLQDMRSPSEWTIQSTFVPPKGYICITDFDNGQHGIKIGDGNTPWSELLYVNIYDLSGYLKSDEISDWAKAENKPAYTATEVGAATAADITAAITDIEIGGRNLLYHSRFDKKYPTGWAYSAVVSYTFDGNAATLTKAETTTRQFTTQASVSNGVVAANPNLLPENGCTYTISCEVMKAEGYDVGNGTKITNRYNFTDGTVKDFDVDVSGASETVWTKYSRTYTYASDKTVRYTQFIVALGAQACGIRIKNVKFEKGNKATDWSPAPEDDERRIASLEARVAALEAAAVSGGEV